jgi:hypothetical protein
MADEVALKSKRERYQKLKQALWNTRTGGGFDAHWRELGDYFMPRRTRFWTGDRNRGDKRNQNIIDSTGRFAARTLASGLHAGLTSPARPWMKLTTPDPDLAEFETVKEWLHDVTTRLLTLFVQANLYNALPIVYGDMGIFATAAMAVLPDEKDLFRCYTYPIGSYALGLDSRGNATTFVRSYELTVRQIVETFAWDKATKKLDRKVLSDQVQRAWDKGDYEQAVTLNWLVTPNNEMNPRALHAKDALPWASCHFEDAATPDRFLRESGFKSFPLMCPRWDVNSPEDSYGTASPGMDALGDNKQLQIMHKRKGQAIEKQVYPSLVGPTALRTQTTSLLAGNITYIDEGQQKALRAIHDVNINLADMTADIRETQYRIQRAFYEDLFLMLAQQDQARGTLQPMTAREVDERHEEKLLALGPVLERTNDELLDPLIDRVFGMMEDVGLVPEPPDELDQVRLKVEYISILSQAQKLVGVIGQDRFLASTMPLMQAFPEVRHKIRIMQVVDDYGDMLGVDPRTIVPTDEAEQAAAAEQQAAAAAAQAQQAKTTADAMKSASQAKLAGGDSALDRLAAGQGAPQVSGGAAA